MEKKKEIFFCYAREDEKLRIELEKQLIILQRQGFISIWHDREISAGKEWEREIDVHLNTAHFILLLVSPDFMVSEYCYGKEMKRAMERHDTGDAHVIPVILRHVYWRGAPFGKLQALPTDGKPVLDRYWHNPDEAFHDVAEGIRKAVEKLNTESREDPSRSQASPNIPEKTLPGHYDVCLSYSAADTAWMENLAKQLGDMHNFSVLLDKWVLSDKHSWKQVRMGVTDQCSCCVVCLGEQTPVSWFKKQTQRLLDRQHEDPFFRIIPALLPGAREVNVHDFPELRVWADFNGDDKAYAFHVLVCGIKGIPPGRWPRQRAQGTDSQTNTA